MRYPVAQTSFVIRLFVAVILCGLLGFGQVEGSNETLGSLEQTMSERPGWDHDPSEVAYVAARCGALVTMLGGYLKENSSKPKDELNGTRLIERGQLITRSAFYAGMLVKMDAEASLHRSAELIKRYGELISSNKRLYNNVFHEPVESDFKFCMGLENNFIQIVEMFDQAMKSKK